MVFDVNYHVYIFMMGDAPHLAVKCNAKLNVTYFVPQKHSVKLKKLMEK